MGMRPRSMQPALRPFLESRGEADAAAASDSGGASFLGQVSTLRACLPHSLVLLHLRARDVGTSVPCRMSSTGCFDDPCFIC